MSNEKELPIRLPWQNVSDLPLKQRVRGWYNDFTGKIEYREGVPADNDLWKYLPQLSEVQGIFLSYIGEGMSPIEAYQKTLEKVIEVKNDLE